ncbi:MAG: hypothetical protein LBV08_08050 [Clostridiales bacterium]|nr:hypothetical protein [Clostridiales bacterium]
MNNNKYDEILKKSAFKNIPQETIRALRELMVSIDGKSMNESIMMIMKFYAGLPKTKPLSKNEEVAMLQAISEGLDEGDQEKFKKITAFFNIK